MAALQKPAREFCVSRRLNPVRFLSEVKKKKEKKLNKRRGKFFWSGSPMRTCHIYVGMRSLPWAFRLTLTGLFVLHSWPPPPSFLNFYLGSHGNLPRPPLQAFPAVQSPAGGVKRVPSQRPDLPPRNPNANFCQATIGSVAMVTILCEEDFTHNGVPIKKLRATVIFYKTSEGGRRVKRERYLWVSLDGPSAQNLDFWY